MRAKFHNQRGFGYYHCLSHDRGYGKCGQLAIRANDLNDQVLWILTNMIIPSDFKERVETAARSRVENAAAIQRMEEIKEIIERIDLRWDQGFISKEEYIEKRRHLDLEVSSLRPIDYDELTEAADLITNFGQYWEGCQKFDQPEVAQQQLVSKIVERVFVHEDKVIALALYGDFGVILGKNETASYLVAEAISENLLTDGEQATYRNHFGKDRSQSEHVSPVDPADFLSYIAFPQCDNFAHFSTINLRLAFR